MALNPRFTCADGEVVWIVGPSTGIGNAVAGQLAGQGASVVVSARKAGPLEAFEARYPACMALPLDVTDADAIYDHLVANGIIVRNRNRVKGCEGCLRITIGTPAENVNVIDALKQYV